MGRPPVPPIAREEPQVGTSKKARPFDVPPASRQDDPCDADAAEQAFGTLLGFVKHCQDEERLPVGDTHQFALLAWSMVHGIAKLATAKRLPL